MRTQWILSCVACVALAQNVALTGTVFDLAGEKVARAPIQATNLETKAVYNTSSSATGAYALDGLPAGRYEVVVDIPGFNKYVQQVTLPVQRVDIHLIDYQLDTLGDGRDFRIGLMTPHATPSGPTPHTPDGKTDFTGVWWPWRTLDGGKPEPLAWAEALLAERAATNSKDAPGSRCLPRGLTNDGTLFPFRFVQTPPLLVMIFEDDVPGHRLVFLDGRSHPKDMNPTWLGHSVGRWEGDTLVVDTAGFNDLSWLDIGGHAHTEKMRIIERFRRPDLGHLEVEMTIEDPGAYAKPWVIRRIADLAAGEELQEFVCNENNRDVEHLVGK